MKRYQAMTSQASLPGTRRDFLRTATVLGAAATAGPLRASVAPSDRLTIGIIGCGGMATHHVKTLPESYQVVALCDVDAARGKALQVGHCPDAQLLADYGDVLSRDDLEAVLVATPDHWHTQISIDAMRAGKNVYCEKPLTLTIAEGTQIVEASEQTGQLIQVGTQQRSDPNFQTAVAIVRAGRIGTLKRVTAAIGAGPAGGPFGVEAVPESLDWRRWLGSAPYVDYRPQRCHGSFRWWYEYSGGKLTDWGAHHVDIALWAMPELLAHPIKIEPLAAVHSPPLVDGMPAVDDHYNTAVTFHVRCHLHGGVELDIRDTAPDLGFENGIMFEGTDGRVFVNRGKLTGAPVEQLANEPLPDGALEDLRRGRRVMDHRLAFQEACRDGEAPISDAASHASHLNVCHATNVAMRLGKTVSFDAANSRFLDETLNTRWLAR